MSPKTSKPVKKEAKHEGKESKEFKESAKESKDSKAESPKKSAKASKAAVMEEPAPAEDVPVVDPDELEEAEDSAAAAGTSIRE